MVLPFPGMASANRQPRAHPAANARAWVLAVAAMAALGFTVEFAVASPSSSAAGTTTTNGTATTTTVPRRTQPATGSSSTRTQPQPRTRSGGS